MTAAVDDSGVDTLGDEGVVASRAVSLPDAQPTVMSASTDTVVPITSRICLAPFPTVKFVLLRRL